MCVSVLVCVLCVRACVCVGMFACVCGHEFIQQVSTCRDEICRPLVDKLDRRWGPSFNIASLAGFCFCGRTGFKAALAHAPVRARAGVVPVTSPWSCKSRPPAAWVVASTEGMKGWPGCDIIA